VTHPITPPPELVQQWRNSWLPSYGEFLDYVATQAAQWGADQELEACVSWVEDYAECGHSLRLVRRPKPPSLKEQALEVLGNAQKGWGLDEVDLDTIRRALEALPND
jgi:hypothetical protein